MIPLERVHIVPEGVTLDLKDAWPREPGVYAWWPPDDPVTISLDQTSISPDGDTWVCYYGQVHCVFLSPMGS